MNQIKIVPIFDQTAPGVWDDFLRIRATAMECNYNYELSSDELERALSEYKNEYQRASYNFAFGAYDNKKMVGFIRGNGVRSTATIKCLYVLPDYQKHRIGHNLLSTAERSIAPAYKNIELISLWHAEKFYQHHNYTTKYGTNTYIKRVDNPHCYDVPLFGFPARIKRMCSNIFPDLDVSVFIAPNTPLFAHFDIKGNIDGMLIGAPQSNRAIVSRAKDDWTKKYLTRTFDNYKQFVSALNPEHVK
ncbi:MAG: GNAT family N-acetyltransferase [Alphaproteobacteria bacterium]|nr:GNAT family N-acetyltransferase [Alphaproteobacteria bacterium]